MDAETALLLVPAVTSLAAVAGSLLTQFDLVGRWDLFEELVRRLVG